jgi:hypothetical protein
VVQRGAKAVAPRNPRCRVDSKGRPLNITVPGGQVHDSQDIGEVPDTPRTPLAVIADKAYDSEKVRQLISDEGALRSCGNAARKDDALKSEISSAASKIGGSLRPKVPCRRYPGRCTLLDQVVSTTQASACVRDEVRLIPVYSDAYDRLQSNLSHRQPKEDGYCQFRRQPDA